MNVIPSDEVIRVISDILFLQVMENKEIGVAPAGGPAGHGAVLEIEAKIGRLMDKNTNVRVHIPVRTETIFDRNYPSLQTYFESSMTEVRGTIAQSPRMILRILVATSRSQRFPQPGAHCYSRGEADPPKAESASEPTCQDGI